MMDDSENIIVVSLLIIKILVSYIYELIEFCTDVGVKGEPIQGKTCLYLSWFCLYKYALHNSVVFLVPADFFVFNSVFHKLLLSNLKTCDFLSGD